MGVMPQGKVYTLPQTPFPRLPLSLQNQEFTRPTKTPHRPLQAPYPEKGLSAQSHQHPQRSRKYKNLLFLHFCLEEG